MPSYIPEHYFGLLPGTYDQYGLVPWPKHLQPQSPQPAMRGRTERFDAAESQAPEEGETRASGQSGVELTKKGEAYCSLAEAGGVMFLTLDRRDRVSIATTIERLLVLLDEMDGDENLEDNGDEEPSLGWCSEGRGACWMDDTHRLDDDREQDNADAESTLGWQNQGSQGRLHADCHDEREDENEHGGDVQDEPHDEDGEKEPSMGWGERCGQGPCIGMDVSPNDFTYDPDDTQMCGMGFDGGGYHEGKSMLSDLRRRRPDVPQHHVRIAPAYGYGGG